MKIHVIGDSISVHYGPYLKFFLADMADYESNGGEAEALRNLDKAQGSNTGDSSKVLALIKTLRALDADLLLVNCGLHDIKRNPETGVVQVPIADYERHLRVLLSVVQGMKPQLVWVRTTPCDEKVHNRRKMGFCRFSKDVEDYNAVADRVMGESGVPSLDLYTFTRNLGPDLYCDHVHFHESIREKQGAFIAGWINCWISGRPQRSRSPE